MRAPLVAGNWKMNLDRNAATGLVREVREKAVRGDVDVLVAPPFPYLDAVVAQLRGSRILVAGQNLHAEPYGAFTGEVSGEMLRDVGCSHVLVGHSERRHIMGERNDVVGLKLARAIAAGLAPILCVGETLAERKAGRSTAIVLDQLDAGLRTISEAQAAALCIAYEPVWAIGTGVNATPAQAGEAHRLIREWLAKRFSSGFADRTRILYGGSVKADNAAELLATEGVDGALVGGASLTAGSFLSIIAACPSRARTRGGSP